MDYLIKLISFNIKYFCEKKICSKESIDYFKKDYINKMINLENYMKYYKDLAKEIMEPKLKSFSIDFIDYQVEVQKMLNKEIKIQNKRRLQDFIENSRQFLCDNFYYIAQVYFIPTYINKDDKGKTNGFSDAVGMAGADFKREFTMESYRQFFLDAGYPDVEISLADGRIPCAVAVMRKAIR
jgi:hypothetical protein